MLMLTTMKKYTLRKIGSVLLMAAVATMYTACQPEDFYGDNGLSSPDLAATFTITPVEGETNTYMLETENKAVAFFWNKGNGRLVAGGDRAKIVLPDAGTYTVGLQTVGKGGTLATTSQELVVETSDPVAGNLVVGGRMDDPDAWTVLKINNDDNVTFNFVNDAMNVSGGNWGHRAIWQPIEVVAGRKYKLDMFVEGSGATDVWFEVYLGTQEPPASGDYSSDGIKMGLNTWTGCGNTSFSGLLSSVGCVGSLNDVNEITFDQSGTIYLLIKSGGGNLGTTGITFDDVEFRGVQ
jgi:hypothetical protein